MKKIFLINIRGSALMIIFIISSLNLYADDVADVPHYTKFAKRQNIEIRGVVRDSIGNLPGVSIAVKGRSNIGTTTDANGKYLLSIPGADVILVFSMVGYETQEIPVKGQNVVNVEMKANNKGLDEVVVVAFGKQKKSEMVGSVTSIKPSELKVPSSNLTTALAGRAAGIIAYQRSGEPGQDNADFFIRGVTTFGYKTSPLILIDQIEYTATDLARLQVDDIASFSILKDATATALYGSRAANGVILVTTKQGREGPTQLAIRLENTISQPVRNVAFTDPVNYMRLANESVLTRNPLGITDYSEEKINNTELGMNPLIYPANDWRKIMFNDRTINQRVNLSLKGGGKVAQFFVSGALNEDHGLLKVDPRSNYNNNIDLKSYSLRSNVTMKLTKSTDMTVRLDGNFDDYNGPIDGGAAMYDKVMRSNPVKFPAFYPSTGKYAYLQHTLFGNALGSAQGTGAGYINPYADMVKGYKDYSSSLMLAQLELTQDLKFITPGLTFNAMGNTNRRSYFELTRSIVPFYYTTTYYDKLTDTYDLQNLNETTATEYLQYTPNPNAKTASTFFYFQARLNYERKFKKHGLSTMLVFMSQNQLNGSANTLELSLPSKNLGVSGRTTYSYDDRYFAEFNFGYNGSERFDANHRFGFFPSGGVSWSVSKEKFLQPLKSVVTNLRLRGTYGVIGNDAIGSPADRFFYLSSVNMNDASKSAYFGRDLNLGLPGISLSRYANSGITWERAKQMNVGFDLGLFNDFTLTAEYFSQVRDNILMTRNYIPLTMGLSAPQMANVGAATGKGIDLSSEYTKSFYNGLWISGMANFTYATSKYKVIEEPVYNEAYRSKVGKSLYQQYGYIAERLFVDDAEAINSPKQFGVYGGGDIKYTDVNRDGQITQADMVPIGNPTLPEITYGFGFSAGYKSFDISAFFQGLANESFWIDPLATAPFIAYRNTAGSYPGLTLNNQVLQAYADSHWSEDNRDVYALWPRLSSTVNTNNTQPSTWFMRDGSFLRLKQVQIGYNLPKGIQKMLHTSTFRIYVNANNLLNFSSFKLWDVEMGGNGLGYPIQKLYNIGINVNFN